MITKLIIFSNWWGQMLNCWWFWIHIDYLPKYRLKSVYYLDQWTNVIDINSLMNLRNKNGYFCLGWLGSPFLHQSPLQNKNNHIFSMPFICHCENTFVHACFPMWWCSQFQNWFNVHHVSLSDSIFGMLQSMTSIFSSYDDFSLLLDSVETFYAN